MTEVDPHDYIGAELTTEQVLSQLDLLTSDEVFRSSKRSIEFLRYVVHETLKGAADQIKERTIGIEVFGRSSSYDTNLDHVVRTAATELRKRLAIYYGDEKHRSELRIGLVPGSYIPKFLPPAESHPEAEAAAPPLPAAEGAKQSGTDSAGGTSARCHDCTQRGSAQAEPLASGFSPLCGRPAWSFSGLLLAAQAKSGIPLLAARPRHTRSSSAGGRRCA